MGHGVIGVADITNLIDDGDGNSWVLNSKQGFQDCEMYAKLEEWLGRKVDENWDTHFDNLELRKGDERHKPDSEWVQCYSCRKWRMLNAGFKTDTLPEEWFCYMPPFNGKCEVPEQQMGRGVIVIGEKKSGHDEHNETARQGETPKKEMRPGASRLRGLLKMMETRRMSGVPKRSTGDINLQVAPPSKPKDNSDDDLEGESSQTEDAAPRPALKRLRMGPAKIYKC